MNKPKCPYCGAETFPSETIGGRFFYACRVCGACSPRRSNRKDACEAAMKRAEMSALEYARERARMCKSHDPLCQDCPFDRISEEEFGGSCGKFELYRPDEAVTIVKQWVQDHPERSEE